MKLLPGTDAILPQILTQIDYAPTRKPLGYEYKSKQSKLCPASI